MNAGGDALGRALSLIQIVETADRAIGRDVTAVWLRDPAATGARLYREAARLRERTASRGIALLVGDRLDVALAVGADGLQVGHRAPPPARLRPHWRGWLGVSCHDAAALAAAAAAGADYVVVSPVRAVPGKGAPLGEEAFAALAREAVLPVVALGGLGPGDRDRMARAGAAGLAARRALRGGEGPQGGESDVPVKRSGDPGGP